MVTIVICAIIILGGYAIGATCETYNTKDCDYTSTQISLPIITTVAAAIIMLVAALGKIEISKFQCIFISMALIIGGIVHIVIECSRFPSCKHYLSTTSMFFNLFAIVITLIFSVN